jgi:diguanylate cyclase (GGDEF)-like protein
VWLLLGQQLVPSPFLPFIAAVALSAWWGGLGPALAATGISALACLLLYILPAPPNGFTGRQIALHLLVFSFVTLLIAALQVARQRAEEALAQQALHDPLTGLPNRLLFQDRVQQALHAAHRDRTSCALLLLDLDRFKEVNDTLGHQVGDLVLQRVAHRIQGLLRESDTLARLGGDEFVVLLPETEERGAVEVGRKISAALSGSFDQGGHAVQVEPSIGISLYPADGEEVATLLQRADLAMYRAKRQRIPEGSVPLLQKR